MNEWIVVNSAGVEIAGPFQDKYTAEICAESNSHIGASVVLKSSTDFKW